MLGEQQKLYFSHSLRCLAHNVIFKTVVSGARFLPRNTNTHSKSRKSAQKFGNRPVSFGIFQKSHGLHMVFKQHLHAKTEGPREFLREKNGVLAFLVETQKIIPRHAVLFIFCSLSWFAFAVFPPNFKLFGLWIWTPGFD